MADSIDDYLAEVEKHYQSLDRHHYNGVLATLKLVSRYQQPPRYERMRELIDKMEAFKNAKNY